MTEEVWAIAFDGYGDPDASASDKRFRLATRQIADDPDGLYIHGALEDYPKEIRLEIAFLDNLVEGGEAEFLAGGSSAVIAALLQTIGRYTPSAVARLTASIGPTDTTIYTDTTGLAGELVYMGREAIVFGAEDGVTAGRYNGCTRGVLGTVADRHLVGHHPIWDLPWPIVGRPIDLIRVPLDGSYDDEVVEWSGVTVARSGTRSLLKLKARLALSILDKIELLGKGRCRGTVAGNSRWVVGYGYGQAEAGSVTSGHLPAAGSDGDDGMVICIDGKWLARARWTNNATEQEVQVAWGLPGYGAEIWSENGLDPGESVRPGTPWWEVVLLDDTYQPQLYNRAAATGKQLPTNPAELVLTFLTTTPGGGNGPWDLGIAYMGAGWPYSRIDVDSFTAAAQRHAGEPVRYLALGLDGEPVSLRELVQQIMKPLHAVLGLKDWKIAWTAFRSSLPYEGAPVVALAQHWGDGAPGEMDYHDDAGLGGVTALAGGYLGRMPREVDLGNATRADLYPYSDASHIEIDVSPYAGAGAMAQRSSVRLSEAYQFPPPILPVTVATDLRLSPGDIVEYSHPDAVQDDGTIGIGAGAPIAAQVLAIHNLRGEEDEHYTTDVSLYLTGRGVARAGAGSIAPCMKVVEVGEGPTPYTAPGSSASGHHELVVYPNFFKTSGSLPIGRDSDGFAAGYDVSIVSYDLARKAGAFEDIPIVAIVEDSPSGYDTIQIDNAATLPIPPVGGDIIRLGTEGSTNAPLTKHAWMAPSSGTFASGRPAFQYALDITPRVGGSAAYTEAAPCDDDGASDEWPYDEALLERLAATVGEVLTQRLGSATCMVDGQKPLLLHGNPWQFGAIIGWYKGQDITELTISLILEGHDATTVVSISHLREGRLVGVYIADASYSNVTNGFSGQINIVVGDFSPDEGMVYMLVRAVSGQDDASKVQLKASEQGAGGPDQTWGTHVKAVVDLGLTDGVLYKVVHNNTGGVWDDDDAVPPEALLLAHTDEELIINEGEMDEETLWSDQYWVYPPYGAADPNGYRNDEDNDFVPVDFIPIAHVKIHAIKIEETATTTPVPTLANYRAGLESAARTIRLLQEWLAWATRNRTVVWAAAAGYQSIDLASDLPDTAADPPLGTLNQLRSYEDPVRIWECWSGLYPETRDKAGTSLGYKRTVIVEGLIAIYEKGSEGSEIGARLRLSIMDTDGTGTPVVGETVDVPVKGVGVSFVYNPLVAQGWLRRFVAKINHPANPRKFSDHPARGLWPIAWDFQGYADWGLVPFRVEVTDNNSGASGRLVVVDVVRADDQNNLSRLDAVLACPWAVCYARRGP